MNDGLQPTGAQLGVTICGNWKSAWRRDALKREYGPPPSSSQNHSPNTSILVNQMAVADTSRPQPVSLLPGAKSVRTSSASDATLAALTSAITIIPTVRHTRGGWPSRMGPTTRGGTSKAKTSTGMSHGGPSVRCGGNKTDS